LNARNRKAANVTRCSVPCSTVARPVTSVSDVIVIVRASRTSSLAPTPSTSGPSSQIEATPIVGMVRPILASAEPSARFRLVCIRLRVAARTAATV
jgi:hypothetical protein